MLYLKIQIYERICPKKSSNRRKRLDITRSVCYNKATDGYACNKRIPQTMDSLPARALLDGCVGQRRLSLELSRLFGFMRAVPCSPSGGREGENATLARALTQRDEPPTYLRAPRHKPRQPKGATLQAPKGANAQLTDFGRPCTVATAGAFCEAQPPKLRQK